MTSLGAQQAAETAAYEKARSQPFNQINGLPSRFDFHELGKQCVTLLHQPNSCIVEHHDSGFIGEVLTNQQYFWVVLPIQAQQQHVEHQLMQNTLKTRGKCRIRLSLSQMELPRKQQR